MKDRLMSSIHKILRLLDPRQPMKLTICKKIIGLTSDSPTRPIYLFGEKRMDYEVN